LAGVDGGAVEDYRAGVVVLWSELEIVGCGALAGYGGRGGGAAVDGEEEGAVRDSVACEWKDGWVGGAGDGESAGALAEGGRGEGEGDLAGGVGREGGGGAGGGDGEVAGGGEGEVGDGGGAGVG